MTSQARCEQQLNNGVSVIAAQHHRHRHKHCEECAVIFPTRREHYHHQRIGSTTTKGHDGQQRTDNTAAKEYGQQRITARAAAKEYGHQRTEGAIRKEFRHQKMESSFPKEIGHRRTESTAKKETEQRWTMDRATEQRHQKIESGQQLHSSGLAKRSFEATATSGYDSRNLTQKQQQHGILSRMWNSFRNFLLYNPDEYVESTEASGKQVFDTIHLHIGIMHDLSRRTRSDESLVARHVSVGDEKVSRSSKPREQVTITSHTRHVVESKRSQDMHKHLDLSAEGRTTASKQDLEAEGRKKVVCASRSEQYLFVGKASRDMREEAQTSMELHKSVTCQDVKRSQPSGNVQNVQSSQLHSAMFVSYHSIRDDHDTSQNVQGIDAASHVQGSVSFTGTASNLAVHKSISVNTIDMARQESLTKHEQYLKEDHGLLAQDKHTKYIEYQKEDRSLSAQQQKHTRHEECWEEFDHGLSAQQQRQKKQGQQHRTEARDQTRHRMAASRQHAKIYVSQTSPLVPPHCPHEKIHKESRWAGMNLPSISEVSVQVENTLFCLERSQLQAHSRLFRHLSADTDDQQTMCKITLKGITVDAFCHILRWIYSGEVELNEANVRIVLDGANNLEIEELVDKCQRFIEEHSQQQVSHSRELSTEEPAMSQLMDHYHRSKHHRYRKRQVVETAFSI